MRLQRRTVQVDKRRRRRLLAIVNDPGDDLLADAGLAFDQHRNRAVGMVTQRLLVDFAHRRRSKHQPRQPQPVAQQPAQPLQLAIGLRSRLADLLGHLLVQQPVFPHQDLPLGHPLHQNRQFLHIDRLQQIVVRPQPQRLDRRIHIAVAGKQHHFRLAAPLARLDRPQQFQAGQPRHPDVGNHQRKIGGLQLLQRLQRTAALTDLMTDFCQKPPYTAHTVPIVIHQQNVHSLPLSETPPEIPSRRPARDKNRPDRDATRQSFAR